MKEVDSRVEVKRNDLKVYERGRFSSKSEKKRSQSVWKRSILEWKWKETT